MEDSLNPGRKRGFKLFLLVLCLCGLVARVAPLFNANGRLLQQHPTEDGYLMLTIARNIALGHGMSTADGTIATNGTQPLVNFLWAGGFWLFDGDRAAGVLFAQLCQVLFSALAAYALYRFGRRVLAEHAHSFEISSLAACAWYATLLSTTHGMNCLETGGYVLAILGFALLFLGRSGDPLATWSPKRSIALGVALGVVFWVRIDAVFLILGTCVARAALCDGARLKILGRNVGSAIIVGLTSIVTASPWLIHNKVNFGSVMPISGTAQSWGASFGQNLPQAIANLAEYVLVVAPIPQPLETRLFVNAACAVILLAAVFAVFRIFRSSSVALRSWIPIAGIFAAGLFVYYGLLFGAPHFVGRYLYPVSAFTALLGTGIAFTLFERFGLRSNRFANAFVALAILGMVAFTNARQYSKGDKHQHFQVVEWIQDNASESDWVGAIQTGTLGFFHDRTLNLDGKVNPDALIAARANQTAEYVVETKLRYLADWKGLASWMEIHPIIAENFDLVVHDEEVNLAVMKRKEGFAVVR